MSVLDRITTRDVLAILVVGAALLFNGISLITGRGPDASTMTLAGAVVGYYFKQETTKVREEPLEEPAIGDVDEPVA